MSVWRGGSSNAVTRSRTSALYALLLCAVLLCALLAFMQFRPSSFPGSGSGGTNYVLVIDCGSSGTRMNAFQFEFSGDAARAGNAVVAPALIPPHAAGHLVPKRRTETRRAYQRVETEPGLSEFLRVSRLQDVERQALLPLLEWARAVVPRDMWADTPVYLLGTAGLRRLDEEGQEAVLEVCRKVLKGSGFRFEEGFARVIGGAEEGVYGWAALNAAEGRLGGPGRETIGALDLGGSSLEVTYYDGEGGGGGEGHLDVVVGEVVYPVRTTSYSRAGLDDAWDIAREMVVVGAGGVSGMVGMGGASGASGAKEREEREEEGNVTYIKHPCLHRGFAEAGGGGVIAGAAYENGTNLACYRLAGSVASSLRLQGGEGSVSSSQSSARDTAISSSQTFAAMSGFYVINHFFGLDTSATVSDVNTATDAFCALQWDEVRERHADELAVETYCFRGAYVEALVAALGVRDVILGYDDGRVGGWTMGFACLMNSARGSRGSGMARGGGRGRMLWAAVVIAAALAAAALALVAKYAERIDRTQSMPPHAFKRSPSRVGSGSGSSRSLTGLEEGTLKHVGVTRSSTVSRKLNEMN